MTEAEEKANREAATILIWFSGVSLVAAFVLTLTRLGPLAGRVFAWGLTICLASVAAVFRHWNQDPAPHSQLRDLP